MALISIGSLFVGSSCISGSNLSGKAVIFVHSFGILSAFAWTFLSLQIKEFRNLCFYVSDSVYGCVFFFLSGLHFFHVVVGLVILGILSSIPGVSSSYLCISQDFFFIFQAVYWHFVEVVWQFIFLILYSQSHGCWTAKARRFIRENVFFFLDQMKF